MLNASVHAEVDKLNKQIMINRKNMDRVSLAERQASDALKKANALQETVRFSNQKYLRLKSVLEEVETCK